MPMKPSLASRAEEAAADTVIVVRAALADGVVTPEEAAEIARRAEQVAQLTRQVHRAQRAAHSIERYGHIVPQISREFGPEELELV